MSDTYINFLRSKRLEFRASGFDCSPKNVNSRLFPHQRDAVLWALHKGRCAIFADTGLGKTAIQLEWARLVAQHIAQPVLIVAPLSVTKQTIREANELLSLEVTYTTDTSQLRPISITNYEHVHKFNASHLGGIVLDESSILKGVSSKTRLYLTQVYQPVPYRLCCTATPAPNDVMEIANHSEFLGIKSGNDIKSTFFRHVDARTYIIKPMAKQSFYNWLASWSIAMRTPADLGYPAEGYTLPPLSINPVWVESDYRPDNQLFAVGLSDGIQGRSQARKASLTERCETSAALVNASMEQWIVWVGRNDESSEMARLIPGAIEVTGSMSPEVKVAAFENFQAGNSRVLITKTSIAGMGMNFQNSHNAVFVGLSDSWEQYYQAVRRQYRFGQQYPVNVYIVLSDVESDIFTNVMRKDIMAKELINELIKNMQVYDGNLLQGSKFNQEKWDYTTNEAEGNTWTLWLGDSCERMKEIADESVDLSVFSPPFQSLYTYQPTARDIGNSETPDQFYQHFGIIISELYRITKPGRIAACHVQDLSATLVNDGWIGMKLFPFEVARLFEKYGWIIDGLIPIDKNQQAQSIRTHAKGLTFSQFNKDRTWSRPALPDFIIKFRKPGENKVPVVGGLSNDDWIEWANPTWPSEDRTQEIGGFPTWYGISESDTLQGWRYIKERERQEKHICPLQIGTIARCILLWSNQGELVFDPFGGIGSTVYTAVKNNRHGMSIELNPAWWSESVRQLQELDFQRSQPTLFEWANIDETSKTEFNSMQCNAIVEMTDRANKGANKNENEKMHHSNTD